jgi:agmatine/peptidylarginine deiminase
MSRRLTSLVALCLLLLAGAAAAEWDVDGIEQLLPNAMTQEEALRWAAYVASQAGDRENDPPPLAPIRNCAEWEPCTGVLIRYPLGLPYNLLRDFDDDVILHVIVSSGNLAAAQSNLAANGVNMDKVQFLVRNSDSIWTRDYGPWFDFDGNGDIAIIDHRYNRPRPNDDLIPIYFGEQQGIPVHHHDMYHTGGNYMTDGAHISSSTDLVYDEAWTYNGMTEEEVDQLMFDYYGIETYYVVDDIESGGIHHIDTWGKFLDEESVLVKDVWPAHYTYSALNQRATLLASLPSSTGRNYTVYRVYCYNIGGNAPASYTNSLILNNAIYMPTFGDTGYDNAALASYQAAAPGYTVRGYYYSGWLSDDALHCRAMGIIDRNMLRVAHVPIVEDQIGPVTVAASVHAHSDLGVQAVELHYRQGGGAWQTVAMTPQAHEIYAGVIPPPASATTTDYYIHATDNGDHAEGMPRVEPAAWYSFLQEGATGVDQGAPAAASLLGNYPNPFNPNTTFSFELLYADQVELKIFDAQGRLVRTLIDGLASAGRTELSWDGRDDQGRPLPSGVYQYRLRAAGLEYSRPAVLMK